MGEIFKRGHKEIVLFSTCHSYFITPQTPVIPRLRGFQEAMKAAGFADWEDRTFFCHTQTPRETKMLLEKILKKYPETTLICGDSDIGVDLIHEAALSMGLNIPGDIALTGFGNISSLKVATVNQNPELQGKLAAKYLIDFWEGKRKEENMLDELIPTTLENLEKIPILR